MGKIRIKTLGDKEKEQKQKQKDEARREGKKIAKQKIKEETVEIKPVPDAPVVEETTVSKKTAKSAKPKGKIRSKRYQKAKSYIDKTKKYQFTQALELVKKTSPKGFDATIELHINTTEKGIKGSVTLPHGIGKQIQVSVVTDELIKEIENGKINFHVLIAHPSFMPKLARLAKVLGPKGMMPNPKNGTISDKPEEAAKRYAGTLQYKTESDFPIIHTVIGKMSFEEKKLEENFRALISSVNPLKISTVFLKSTMSPSVKVEIER